MGVVGLFGGCSSCPLWLCGDESGTFEKKGMLAEAVTAGVDIAAVGTVDKLPDVVNGVRSRISGK